MSTKTLTSEITNAVDRFMNYINDEDLKQIISMYSDDASVLPPGEKSFYGIEAICQFWDEMLNQTGCSNMTYIIEKIEPLGDDIAAEMSSYELTMAGKRYKGKYTMIWKKIRNEWRIHIDMFNVST
jgi:ketosteroid isomerase-like protein